MLCKPEDLSLDSKHTLKLQVWQVKSQQAEPWGLLALLARQLIISEHEVQGEPCFKNGRNLMRALSLSLLSLLLARLLAQIVVILSSFSALLASQIGNSTLLPLLSPWESESLISV